MKQDADKSVTVTYMVYIWNSSVCKNEETNHEIVDWKISSEYGKMDKKCKKTKWKIFSKMKFIRLELITRRNFWLCWYYGFVAVHQNKNGISIYFDTTAND